MKAPKTKVMLSIDWDYFFPRIDAFDWGHNETTGFLLEGIWLIRAYQTVHSASCGLEKDHTKIIDYLQPQEGASKFWDKLGVEPSCDATAVAESHQTISSILELHNKWEVWNFDAHHDTGYGAKDEKLNCGNWVQHFRDKIETYRLVYPSWRREFPESKEPSLTDYIYYEIPLAFPQKFDYIFICRSGAWTPSWCDREWIDFYSWWERSMTWHTNRYQILYAMRERGFSQRQALDHQRAMDTMMEEMNARNKNQ